MAKKPKLPIIIPTGAPDKKEGPPTKLTDEQKVFLRLNFLKTPDINVLTDALFPGKRADDPEGKLVRDFLLSERYNVALPEKKEIVLTDSQKALIDELYDNGKGVKTGIICKRLWLEKKIGFFSPEWKVVADYLKETHGHEEEARQNSFERPTTIEQIVEKINALNMGKKIDPKKLNIVEKAQCEALLASTSSARYKRTVDGFNSKLDKDLFEDSFYRATYDKPDLTVDEINLYISLCDGYVKATITKKHIAKLNELFEGADDSSELSMKLVEAISSKNKELDEIEKRGESLIKKLNGDRAVRLKDRGAKTANILALVTAFQDAEERKRILKIAEIQRQDVSQEVEKLESASDLIARIVGISKWSAI